MVGQRFSGKTDETEKWYGTQFSHRKISPEIISQWENVAHSDQLHLPAVNEFIPTNFDLLTPPEGAPIHPVLVLVRCIILHHGRPRNLLECFQDSEMSKVWYKQDDTFSLPKACLCFLLSTLVNMERKQKYIHYLYLQTSGLPGPNFRSADFSLHKTACRRSQRVRLQRRDCRDSVQNQTQLLWSHCEPSPSPWRELSLLSLFSLPSPLLSPPLLNLVSKHSSIYQPCCLSIDCMFLQVDSPPPSFPRCRCQGTDTSSPSFSLASWRRWLSSRWTTRGSRSTRRHSQDSSRTSTPTNPTGNKSCASAKLQY